MILLFNIFRFFIIIIFISAFVFFRSNVTTTFEADCIIIIFLFCLFHAFDCLVCFELNQLSKRMKK